MVLLKEDGSLDVERINKLPIEEKMDVIRNLTSKQLDEYWDNHIIKESYGYTNTVVVDYTLDEELNNGAVVAIDFINKLRKRQYKQ